MGKKKSRPSADKIRSKRKGQEKKVNPFEVKINRQKHDVLGRKTAKFEKGMPGVSRAKANKKRKISLLKEYEQQFKKNRVVDKRFGERDTSLSLEEKMMRRYAMERAKSTGKNKFNLNEDEELTHYGQSLADIEKFDEPVISDEEEDDDDKRAAAKLVAQEHFGGFLKKKNPEDEKKSWKERMEEMIKESKKKKHERQMEKEETLQMTEQLDEQWKSLHSLLSGSRMKGKEEEKKAADEYDIAVRSLQFEMKGQATDRLKSEEELAREEKERLERLEADRIRRMKGLSEDDIKPQPKHRSADDLDDGFAMEPQDFDYVSYKDGVLNKDTVDIEERVNSDSENENDDEYDSDNDDDSDNEDGELDEENSQGALQIDEGDSDSDDALIIDEDNSDNDEEERSESKGGSKGSKKIHTKSKNESKTEMKEIEKTGKKKAKERDEDEESDDNRSEETDDDYEDLESDEEADDVTEETKIVKKSNKLEDKAKKLMIEQAKKELPYTFKAPESYDDLLDVLEGHSMEDQLTIISRIRKCHHPSLAEGNKQKLESLFGHLTQFYCDLCIQDPPQLDFVDRLVSNLYEMTQMSAEYSASVILANLRERQEEFAEICNRRSGRGLYPGLDTLMLFKLVSVLFPTSDFRHPVTTPAVLFMGQILGQTPVSNGRDIVAGLFLCNLCLEYVSMSKRYIPEVVSFLHGLLFYAADKDPKKIEFVMPPFKPVGSCINLLQVQESVERNLLAEKWSLSEMLAPEVDENLYKTDCFTVTALYQCLKLLTEFKQLYKDVAAFNEIFSPVICMCSKLPMKKYPPQIQKMVTDLKSSCEEICKLPRKPLAMQKKKPKPLKMFEPKVEEKFDGRKKGKRGTKDFNEKQKLIHKYKKEMKGAVRELKKDSRFLARQKLQETMEKDYERKRKVKELMGALAQQEGDYKKMKRGVKPE